MQPPDDDAGPAGSQGPAGATSNHNRAEHPDGNTCNGGTPWSDNWPTWDIDPASEALALSPTPPPAASDILVTITGTGRLGLLYDEHDPHQDLLAAVVTRLLGRVPTLAGYARTILAQLPLTVWTGPDGVTTAQRFCPLALLWPALFPPAGVRMVTLDLDELRDAHARLTIVWDEAS
jgi:hypothetical protein